MFIGGLSLYCSKPCLCHTRIGQLRHATRTGSRSVHVILVDGPLGGCVGLSAPALPSSGTQAELQSGGWVTSSPPRRPPARPPPAAAPCVCVYVECGVKRNSRRKKTPQTQTPARSGPTRSVRTVRLTSRHRAGLPDAHVRQDVVNGRFERVSACRYGPAGEKTRRRHLKWRQRLTSASGPPLNPPLSYPAGCAHRYQQQHRRPRIDYHV